VIFPQNFYSCTCFGVFKGFLWTKIDWYATDSLSLGSNYGCMAKFPFSPLYTSFIEPRVICPASSKCLKATLISSLCVFVDTSSRCDHGFNELSHNRQKCTAYLRLKWIT